MYNACLKNKWFEMGVVLNILPANNPFPVYSTCTRQNTDCSLFDGYCNRNAALCSA